MRQQHLGALPIGHISMCQTTVMLDGPPWTVVLGPFGSIRFARGIGLLVMTTISTGWLSANLARN
ncbi:hypothetical protein CC78DRAFT_621888 [Lojkania enalia]|uniref:Uncharacterized protein n=1 Tax=Lojkania enalia TaxID=147567 RepID=A0A9P4JWC8_9PLEO|nr:hypothetical protein CC78DRAFT_621888 [Didymosphaeria enalia]